MRNAAWWLVGGVLSLRRSCFCIHALEKGVDIFDDEKGDKLDGGIRVEDVVCRLNEVDTIYEGPGNETFSEEQLACTLIDSNGHESDDFLSIDLPDSFFAAYEGRILEQGDIFLSIPNATVTSSAIQFMDHSTTPAYHLIDPPSNLQRHRRMLALGGPQASLVGQPTLAIIRISTRDNPSLYTKTALYEGIFGKGIVNVVNQYAACSFNKLRWRPARAGNEQGVFDVPLPATSLAYGNDRNLILKATHEFLKTKYQLDTVAQLADKVFMCVPPNSGAFIASAGVGHWRAQFNSGWCLSLTATMHELGHTLGLRHANLNGVPYADATGYMAGGTRESHWPVKCFNGFNNWQMGFYRDRHMEYNPFRHGRQRIELATFVDYSKTPPGTTVLISIADTFYLQYNVARGINKDTGAKRNQVTVTEGFPGSSESRAGIGLGDHHEFPDFKGSRRTLVIRICRRTRGSKRIPESVQVSVGLDFAHCERESSPTPSHKAVRTRPPTKSIPFFFDQKDVGGSSRSPRDILPPKSKVDLASTFSISRKKPIATNGEMKRMMQRRFRH